MQVPYEVKNISNNEGEIKLANANMPPVFMADLSFNPA